LQLLILALLAEKPAHGYEIIKEIGERSGGFYNPSPGMVYPALTYLEEIGYASVEAEGTRKRYAITDEGRAHLAQNQRHADTILAQMRWMAEKMQHVRRAFGGDRPQGWNDDLYAARNALREALAGLGDATEEVQRRVADILERAAKEIRRK
jgi:DNA-binding PadR family transcriptional regulator